MRKIDKTNLPKHIAITMDGNGRWAKTKGKLRVFGHKNGVKAVRDTVESAAEIGIEFLTLYAFSTENWKRPESEVNALMTLLVSAISKETKNLMDNNIRLSAIGDTESLPSKAKKELLQAIEKNNVGKLFSSDFPYFRLENPEQYIGIVVPNDLKKNWRLLTS